MSNNVTWDFDGSGSWFTAADWSGGAVPGPHDHVTLTSAAAHTISYNGTDTVSALISTDDLLAVTGGTLMAAHFALEGGLQITGGVLSMDGRANTLAGGVTLTGGEITLGGGARLEIDGPATLGPQAGGNGFNIAGPGLLVTTGVIEIPEDGGDNEADLGGGLQWENTGTVVDNGIFSAAFTPGIAFTILNQAGAVYDFTTDTACLMNGGADGQTASSDFKNAGLLEKTGGTGDTTFYATVTSTGTIALESGTLDFEDGGTIGGTIEGPANLELDGGGTLHNALAIDTNLHFAGGITTLSGVTASGVITVNATAEQTGRLTLGATGVAGQLVIDGVYQLAGGAGIATGAAGGVIDIAGGTLAKTAGAGAATIAPAITDDGAIIVDAGSLRLSGSLTGTGRVTIGAGAGFEAGAVAAGIAVTLGGGAELILDQPALFSGAITGFTAGTTLDLRGLDVTTATASSAGTLTLEDSTTVVGTLLLTNNDSGVTFTYVTDGHGGTLLGISSATATRMGFLAASSAATPTSPAPLAHPAVTSAPSSAGWAATIPTAAGAISLTGTPSATSITPGHALAALVRHSL